MKQIMSHWGHWEEEYIPGRKQPLYYWNDEDIIVLGHYNSPCGGCDTIGSARQVFELIQKLSMDDCIILCEGLLLSEDVKWSSQLDDLRVLFLATPLETCLSQIEQRRRAAGNDKPLDPENTSRRVAVIERARLKLIEAGKLCRRCTAEHAADRVLDWIGEK